MHTGNFCKMIFAAAALLICCTTYGQKEENFSREVWKKKVARIIDMAQKDDDANHHLKDVRQDTSMIDIMINAIKAGKLAAYANYDAEFTTRLTMQGLKEMTEGKTDTIEVVDPITNQKMIKITHRDFDGSSIHKYRILEEWAFNPHTGKTEIQITGIAPLREIYDDNGTFRGVQAMFWVRYNDVRGIMAKYEQYHPDNTIAGHIWADYFLSDVRPEAVK